MKTKRIYLDNAATTPTDERVVRAMAPYFGKIFGNAGALHKEGVGARAALLAARERTARILQVRREEIIFTSGGTEGNNLAIRGIVRGAKAAGINNPHIVTTAFEHSAVLETCRALEKEGIAVTYVKPEKNGIVSPEKIKKAINANTVLVSLMYVNNEIGTIQPIREISKIVREYRNSRRDLTLPMGKVRSRKNIQLPTSNFPLLHTDACQAANYLDVCPNHLGVDLTTLAGSKIYGPKGSGVLFVRHGAPILPIMHGGNQEGGLRPGTEPVYLAFGFAEALGISDNLREKESKRITALRDYFIAKLLSLSQRVSLNGEQKRMAPHIINVCIGGIDNEFFVIELDNAGIACSTRSACKADDERGSHVIISLGKSEREAKETIRFSMGRSTTKQDLDYTLGIMAKLLK